MPYLITLLNLLLIYLMLSVSTNLVLGYGGFFVFVQAGIFGIGAYASAVLTTKFSFGVPPALGMAILCGALAGLGLSLVSLRVNKDYVVLASIALQQVLTTVFYAAEGITGGPYGITGIPLPSFGPLGIDTPLKFLGYHFSLTGLGLFLAWRWMGSPYGLAVKGLREDEVLTATSGIDTGTVKLKLFALSGGMAGLAGAMYAHYITYIDPTSFTLMESVFIVSTVLLGGAGTLWGSIIGTAILVGLPELLKFLKISSSALFFIRQIFLSLLILLILYFRPQGLKGEYAPA